MKYGPKPIVFLFLSASTTATLFCPLATRLFNFWGLIALRFVIGLGSGVFLPAVYSLLSVWCPPSERSFAFGMLYAGGSLGAIVTLVVGGILSEHFGWVSVFYVSGIMGALWLIGWLLLVHDNPSKHPRISPEEKEFIVKSLAKVMETAQASTKQGEEGQIKSGVPDEQSNLLHSEGDTGKITSFPFLAAISMVRMFPGHRGGFRLE